MNTRRIYQSAIISISTLLLIAIATAQGISVSPQSGPPGTTFVIGGLTIGEACTISATDGTGSTFTAGSSTHYYVGNGPLGTTITVKCPSGSVTFSISGPKPATPPPDGTPGTEVPATPPATAINVPKTICTTASNANIRKTPSESGSWVGTLTPSQQYTPISATTSEGGVWYQIGADQWVASWIVLTDVTCGITSTQEPTATPMYPPCENKTDAWSDVILQSAVILSGGDQDSACNSLAKLPNETGEIVDESIINLCEDKDYISDVLPGYVQLLSTVEKSLRDDVNRWMADKDVVSDPCEAMRKLIQDQQVDGNLADKLGNLDRLTLLGLSCNPHIGLDRAQRSASQLIGYGIFLDGSDTRREAVCGPMTEAGGNDDLTVPLEALTERVETVCGYSSAKTFEIIEYAKVIKPGIIEALNNLTDSQLCDKLKALKRYAFETDITLSDEDQQLINKIAGAVSSCAPNPSKQLVLSMLIFNRRETLGTANINRLIHAADPCQAIVDYIVSGVLPPTDEGNIWPDGQLPSGDDIPNDPNLDDDTISSPMCQYGDPSVCGIVGSSTGIFVRREDQSNQLWKLERGQRNPVGDQNTPTDTANPALDSTGNYIAYVRTGTGEIEVANIRDGSFTKVLQQSELNDWNLTVVPNYAPAWEHDKYLLVTLIEKSTNVTSIYRIDVTKGGIQPELLIANAAGPSYFTYPNYSEFYSRTSGIIAYETFTPEGNSQVATQFIYENQPTGAAIILSNPGNAAHCFAPAFEVYNFPTFLFTCGDDNNRAFYQYDENGDANRLELNLDQVSGIDKSRVYSLSPGPAHNYMALDDGHSIFFSYIDPDSKKRRTEALLKLNDADAISMHWAANGNS